MDGCRVLIINGFHGSLNAPFDASITPQQPDYSFLGSYRGFGFYVNFLLGVRVAIFRHADAMLLAGYRAGGGYMWIRSSIQNASGVFPIGGPVLQATLKYKF